jgi:hypothetical protein
MRIISIEVPSMQRGEKQKLSDFLELHGYLIFLITAVSGFFFLKKTFRIRGNHPHFLGENLKIGIKELVRVLTVSESSKKPRCFLK